MLRLAIGIIVVASAHGALAASAVATPDPLADGVAAKVHAGSAAASAGRAEAGAPAQLQTVSVPAARQPAASDNPLWAVPLGALSATRDRPIFSSSRRSPPAAIAAAVAKTAAAPKPKEPEHPQLSLVGTIANSLEQFGIFLDQSTAAAIRLRVGEEFQGWTLSSVQGREATLEKDQKVVVLSLPQPGVTITPAALSRLNLAPQPIPGQPQLLSAPQPRRRLQPGRQM